MRFSAVAQIGASLKVLHEVEHLKQREGAELLGMSERGFRKVLRQYREKGDPAVVHGPAWR
jgi:predicted DNA-binding protein (UPF0251 family)